MKFTANGQHYEFDESRITFAEARAIEGATGSTMKEIGAEMARGSVTAMQALIWVAVRRTDPSLKFSDIDDWDIGSIDVDADEPAPEGADADPFDSSGADAA